MRNLLLSCLIAVLAASTAAAFEVEDRRWFGSKTNPAVRVISTTDTELMAPLIDGFLVQNPGLSVEYVVTGRADVMVAVTSEAQTFDLALSSAMDLQTNLANDGFARTHRSPATSALPEWAEWRAQVFGFSQEPASIVVSAALWDELGEPRTREALITLLRDNPAWFYGRIGTYDAEKSGLGYLFATQDARSSETYWRLKEVMGGLGARLYCCPAAMIEDVARGDLLIAYNVLGSYARVRQDLAEDIVVIDPEDYTHLMMRSAVVLKAGNNPDAAKRFVDYLVQIAWADAQHPLYPFARPFAAEPGQTGAKRPIQMGPGFLVYLERAKRQRFLAEWGSAVRQP